MLREFHLEEPETVEEASALLARHGETAKVYAGGTELLLAMKESLIRSERLINIKKIPDLDGVKLENGSVRIGPLTTHRTLEEDARLQKHLPAFVQMEHNVANVRVREAGTLGGNLCFAEPHSDPGALLLVLNAKLIVEKVSSKREVPIGEFFADAFETCLGADEILTEIRVPLPPSRSGLTYIKFGYLERPSVGLALFLRLGGEGRSIAEARIALGSVGPKPKRVEEAESQFRDKAIDDVSGVIARAGEIAARASEAVSDIHGPADYKEHIVRVLLQRAFDSAYRQCLSGEGEEGS
jgi:carbon-monoxide dehydrogenase medium subunit